MGNKVYKLKQEYPGSPKEGTVVVEKENGYEGLGITFPHKKFVEDYPNNWELQVEKPKFRILSIINSCGDIKEGKKVIYEWIYQMYPNYIINSVERLSDGEIFKIGDTIKHYFVGEFTIKNFKIIEEDLVIFHELGLVRFLKGDLTTIFKVKTKLFTTEDGVDVFEGDSFAHTSGATEPKVKIATKKHLNYSLPMDKLFSTKEKAEEYIKMNKPEFSRNQIINLLDSFHFGGQMKHHFMSLLIKEIIKK